MSKPRIDVCISPLLLPLYNLEEYVVVVIDILRATSTITVAIDHGVEKIIPVDTVEKCLAYKDKGFLLAAERNGHKYPGFEYGNSPLDYQNQTLAGKTLVLTTTNGTYAIEKSKNAKQILTSSFLNLEATTDYLIDRSDNVLLLCAGWKDQVNFEDTLFAGAAADVLRPHFLIESDAVLGSLTLYRQSKKNILRVLRNSSHFTRLNSLGMDDDIDYCLSLNLHPVVTGLVDGAIVKMQ